MNEHLASRLWGELLTSSLTDALRAYRHHQTLYTYRAGPTSQSGQSDVATALHMTADRHILQGQAECQALNIAFKDGVADV